MESKLQDWKVLLACIGHHNSAGLSSPAAGVLCTPRGKTGQKMLTVWKPMSKVTPKSKGQNSSDMDFPKKWDPKIRIWIARRVEIAEFISHVAKSWDDKLKPTGDFTKLGYSRNRDVKNQVCKFYKPWVDSRQLGHHKQTVENSRQIMSEEAGVGQ